jgi:hypothetical protein
MPYIKIDDYVTLTMTPDEFTDLVLALGLATGAAGKLGDVALFWKFIGLANRINQGNPLFRPFEIPERYAAADGKLRL